MVCQNCNSTNLQFFVDEFTGEKYYVCNNCGSILDEEGEIDVERTIESFGY